MFHVCILEDTVRCVICAVSGALKYMTNWYPHMSWIYFTDILSLTSDEYWIRQVCLPEMKCVQLYLNTRMCLCLIQPVVVSVDCCAILWHSVKFLSHNSVDVTLVTGLYASQLDEIVFLYCIELIKVMVGKWSIKAFCGTL